MTTQSCELTGTEARWKSVQLGLRLANSYFGGAAIILIYFLWLMFALALCLVMIPFIVRGKVDFEKDIINPFALYGFVWPIGLTFAAMWTVKFVSRVLWCRVPEPSAARFLAVASVVGRLSVLAGLLSWFWHSSAPLGKFLLATETITCSAIAWVCLVADWGFLRILRHHFLPANNPVLSPPESVTVETAPQPGNKARWKSIFSNDVGDLFKARFPKMHKIMSWVLFPLAYIGVSSLAENGDIKAIPAAILKFIVIAPVMLQLFWPSVTNMDKLIGSVSEKTTTAAVQ